jgi:hypothetical protein
MVEPGWTGTDTQYYQWRLLEWTGINTSVPAYNYEPALILSISAGSFYGLALIIIRLLKARVFFSRQQKALPPFVGALPCAWGQPDEELRLDVALDPSLRRKADKELGRALSILLLRPAGHLASSPLPPRRLQPPPATLRPGWRYGDIPSFLSSSCSPHFSLFLAGSPRL